MGTRLPAAGRRWLGVGCALAAEVFVLRRWLPANTTTVALALLMLVLVVAARFTLRLALALTVAATVCYNFYFLPPVKTLTISDPQNWEALFAFAFTAVVASRLAERARAGMREARLSTRELEILLHLSSELLQNDRWSRLLPALPAAVARVCGAAGAALYLPEVEELVATEGFAGAPPPNELRALAETLHAPATVGGVLRVPVRSGVRPRGLLLLPGASLLPTTAEAIGRLLAVALDRARALEAAAREEAAAESERLRRLMIDALTHELRTPLTSIKGAATALLETSPTPAQAHELLAIIDEEADRLNRLVAEAVEVAQLDAREIKLHASPVELRRVIEDALEACSAVVAAHPVEVSVAAALYVYADPHLLARVVSNLLGNAGKYSAAGMPIALSARVQGRVVQVEIADRGFGIAPREGDLIFERFFRGEQAKRRTAGTGMGLAISRAIAEAHGGGLWARNREGGGAVFVLELPLAGDGAA